MEKSLKAFRFGGPPHLSFDGNQRVFCGCKAAGTCT